MLASPRWPGFGAGELEAASVVGHPQLHALLVAAKGDPHRRRAGVPPGVDHRLLGDAEQLARHLGAASARSRARGGSPRRSAGSRPAREASMRGRKRHAPRSRRGRGPPSRRGAPGCSGPSAPARRRATRGHARRVRRARARRRAWTGSCRGRSAPEPGRRGSTAPRAGAPPPRRASCGGRGRVRSSREAVSAVRRRPTTRPVEIVGEREQRVVEGDHVGVERRSAAHRGAGHQHHDPDDREQPRRAAHPGSGRGRRSGRWRRSARLARRPGSRARRRAAPAGRRP